MAVFKEATDRMFGNVFVCKDCKHKIRANPLKVRQGKVRCRFCHSKALRPKRKKGKMAKN